MATHQGQEILRQSLRQAPQVGWDTDVHQHWQHLKDYIHLQLQTHFPKPKCPRRHTIFSDQTWTHLDRRKTFKAKLCEWDGLWTESLLRWAICAWRIRATLVEGLGYVKFQLYTVILLQRFLLQGFRDAAFGLKQRVKHDKAEFIDQVASQAQSSKGLDIYQELKKLRIGSKFRKRGPSTLPGFGGAEDYNQSDQIWAEHCSKMEAAVQTTTSRLLQRCRQDGSRRLEDFSDFTYEHMPTLVELESSFRRIKSHKAGGLDDLKSDLCHLAPKELSEMFYPLLVKSFANLQEPLQAKGGILISAFKGGGGQWSRREDHRSLLLSSHLGKAMRRTVRQKLLPFYTSTAPDLRCSVRAGGCVAHASHGLRLFAQACKQRHLSSGILFLDIRAAYYRVIRQFAAMPENQEWTEEKLARLFLFFNLDVAEYQQLCDGLARGSECLQSGVPLQLEHLASEMLSSTWFVTPARVSLHETLAGSRPGDGLADLVFGYVFKRIMKQVTEKLEARLGPLKEPCEIPFDLTLKEIPELPIPKVVEVVWADDLAIGIQNSDGEQLIEEVQFMAKTVIEECLQHAMIPNMKAGKTELLLSFRGKGSRALKKWYFNVDQPFLDIPVEVEGFNRLRLTPVYRHLGTRVHMTTSMMPELKTRMGQTSAVYRKHRKILFQNTKISLRKRVFLFQSLVLSILRYNAGTWTVMNKTEFKYFKTKLHAMYRGLLRKEIPEEELRLWSTEKVLSKVCLPDAATVLLESRLRYALTLYKSGPPSLWQMILVEKKWLLGLQEAHHWFLEGLRGYGPNKQGVPWNPDLHEWMRHQGHSFKPWIGKASRLESLQRCIRQEWQDWHFDFYRLALAFGLQARLPLVQGDVIDDFSGADACLMCRKFFVSKAAWAVHAFKAHGRTNKCRQVIAGTRCESCMREYGTTARLLAHLMNSPQCYGNLRQAGHYFEVLPGRGSKLEDKGDPFKLPVMQSQGPQPRDLQQDAVIYEDDNFDEETMEGLLNLMSSLPATTGYQEGCAILRQHLELSVLGFAELRRHLRNFNDRLDFFYDNEMWSISMMLAGQIVEFVMLSFRLENFFTVDEMRGLVDDDKYGSAVWEHCHSFAKNMPSWKTESYVPKFKSSSFVVLHLYSGERRFNDLQSYLEGMVMPDGYTLVVLSVDVIFDAISGDLASETNQTRWERYVTSGCIAMIFSGPPCETWSRARLQGGVAGEMPGDGGPRIVRTCEVPYGVACMKVPEAEQVLQANRLLLFTLKLFLLMTFQQRFMMIEHPSPSPRAEDFWLASIWKLFATRMYQNHPHVWLVEILQGYYNGKAPKPTTLLFTCGPQGNAQEFLDGKRTTALPSGLVMGKDASGEYRTAGLKTYPGDLCGALASFAQSWIFQYVQNVPGEGLKAQMDEFLKFSAGLLQSFNTAVVRGADYCRGSVS